MQAKWSSLKSYGLTVKLLEYHTYINNNREFIPNYAEHYRYNEIITTAFTVISA